MASLLIVILVVRHIVRRKRLNTRIERFLQRDKRNLINDCKCQEWDKRGCYACNKLIDEADQMGLRMDTDDETRSEEELHDLLPELFQ